jgi:hypothetical protein
MYLNIYKENGYYILEDKELKYIHSFDNEERLALIKMLEKVGKKTKEKREFTSHEEELQKIWDSPQKHIKIIALFIKATKINLDNLDKVKSVISRNSRSASLLKGYKYSRIIEVMNYLNKTATYKWTLETVGKFIDYDLNKFNTFSNQPKKALGEFEIK